MKRKATALMAAMLAAAGASAMAPGTALAAEKIIWVSVDFKIEGYDEYGCPEIVAEVPSSAHYSCGMADLESEFADDDDDSSSAKKIKSAAEENYIIEFTAEDGYAFYLTKAEQVKLMGRAQNM